MAKDVVYTNGIIAVRETALLGPKLIKMCSMSADEAFRFLIDGGFGRGASAHSVYEYENLLISDETELNDFVREYAPSVAEKAYFSAPRDFHNAKALIKAKFTGADAAKMLAPDGLVSSEVIFDCVESGDFTPLYKELKETCEEAVKLFTAENGGEVSGADIGVLFERAKYRYLLSACKRNAFLKKLVIKKADMTDILSAFRSATVEAALKNSLAVGKIKSEQIEALFAEDGSKAIELFEKTPYGDFVKECVRARSEGRPLTDAEKNIDNLETDVLAEGRYELKAAEPFIYYVLRRRAENGNLRIIFVCLLAGLSESEIRKRLRAV